MFLLGFVPEARKYLRAFDIFTLTSLKEGHPYVLLEAAEAELPVIGSSISGIAEIVQNQTSGILVAPKDFHGIAAAINTLLGDRAKMERLGKSLKESAHTRFSFKIMLDETTTVYGMASPQK